MSELTDFLLARIAEDERAALSLIADEAPMTYAAENLSGPTRDDEYSALHVGAGRVLAECAAKRRIVELHSSPFDAVAEIAERAGEDWVHLTDDAQTLTHVQFRRNQATLRALASIYAGQPGWREEWQ